MAAVHFTTMPCKLNTANRHIASHFFFAKFVQKTNNIVYSRFEVFRTFPCVFMSVVRVLYAKIMDKCTIRHLYGIWWIAVY